MKKQAIRVKVNGVTYEREVEPRRLLADFLREEVGLTGTHTGCDLGQCGACTVLLDGESVKSCLVLAVQADAAEVLTVEGLGRDGQLHPLQEAFRENHAVQCGYCTPGMLMAAYELLQSHPQPSAGALDITLK